MPLLFGRMDLVRHRLQNKTIFTTETQRPGESKIKGKIRGQRGGGGISAAKPQPNLTQSREGAKERKDETREWGSGKSREVPEMRLPSH
jgi:hypothetical protein